MVLLFHNRILCQNSLTRELKIVVGFELKKLYTHLDILIVSYAPQFVDTCSCCFVFYLF